MASSNPSRMREMWRRIIARLRRKADAPPNTPEDPYAYVTAPKRPRPSGRSSAAVAEIPEE